MEVKNDRVGATTSPVQIEVIPKLVEIGKGSSYTTGHMQGPPSPSKTLMLAKSSGGKTRAGVARGGKVEGSEDGMGGGKQKSTDKPLF